MVASGFDLAVRERCRVGGQTKPAPTHRHVVSAAQSPVVASRRVASARVILLCTRWSIEVRRRRRRRSRLVSSDVARTVLLSSSVRPSASDRPRSSARARAGGPSSLAGRWASVSARRRRPGRGSQRARGGGRGSRLDGDAESSSVAWDAVAALIRLVVTAPAAAVVVVVVASAALLAPISSLIGQYYSGLGQWRN